MSDYDTPPAAFSASPPTDPVVPTPAGNDAMGERHRQFVAMEQRLIWTIRGLMVLMILVILGFFLGFVHSAKTMYTAENFAGPVQEQMTNLAPIVSDHLVNAINNTRPKLTALISERWQVVQPQLTTILQNEFTTFRKNLINRMEEDLTGIVKTVVAGKEDRLKADMPQFTNPKQREAFRTELRDRLLASAAKVADQAYGANRHAVDAMLVTLQDFRGDNPYSTMDDEELHRQYLHNWIELVDYHIVFEPITGGE